MEKTTHSHAALVEMTAEIVSAYVANHAVSPGDISDLIRSVHQTLDGLGQAPEAPPAPLTPATSIKKSITDDAIICLEDGKAFKSLKRHLTTKYGMTPDEYRKKWGLPADYPMVAPNYAKQRSELARKMGLGRSRKKN